MHAFLYFEFPGLEANPSSIGRTWKPDKIAGGDSSQRRNDDSFLAAPYLTTHSPELMIDDFAGGRRVAERYNRPTTNNTHQH
jgi:hypothetical protein